MEARTCCFHSPFFLLSLLVHCLSLFHPIWAIFVFYFVFRKVVAPSTPPFFPLLLFICWTFPNLHIPAKTFDPPLLSLNHLYPTLLLLVFCICTLCSLVLLIFSVLTLSSFFPLFVFCGCLLLLFPFILLLVIFWVTVNIEKRLP